MATSEEMISPKLRQYMNQIDRNRSQWNVNAQHARTQAAQLQASQDAADARDRRLARGAVPPAEAPKVWAHVQQIMRLWLYAAKNRCRATNRALDQYVAANREYGNLPLQLAHEELLATNQVTSGEMSWTFDATQKDREAAAALASG